MLLLQIVLTGPACDLLFKEEKGKVLFSKEKRDGSFDVILDL